MTGEVLLSAHSSRLHRSRSQLSPTVRSILSVHEKKEIHVLEFATTYRKSEFIRGGSAGSKGVFGCNLEASDSVQNPLIRSDFACTASKI
jgi:hypothetical protein